MATSSKRPRLDSGYISSLSASPKRAREATAASGTMILYNGGPKNHGAAMKGPSSMEELVSSPAMTLTIGPERNQTTVQSNLFRGISEPLHQLLNSPVAMNGDLSEINETLQYDDKAAFLQLTKMAYSIVLKGQGIAHATVSSKSVTLAPPAPATTATTSIKSPKCPDCKKPKMQLVFTCLHCNPAELRDGVSGLKAFFEVQFPFFIDTIPLQSNQAGSKALLSALDTKDPATGSLYKLLHFAKVFALADKYDVADLRLSAYKAFQRRLKKISSQELAGEQTGMAAEVIDALRYLAYTTHGLLHSLTAISEEKDVAKTEDLIGTKPCQIRIETSDLLASLIRYVVIHVDCLLDDDEFKEIVVEHGVIGLALLDILRQSMAASEP